MTTKPADVPKGTKLEIYMAKMLPEERAQQLYAALPQHIKPEAFKRNIINALMNNPKLLDYAPGLVYREISRSVSLGLLLDLHLGEAYIIEGWNGKTRQKEPQLRIGYKGIIKLARQSGNVSGVWAHEVRANDHFVVEQGFPKTISHQPKAFGDRGEIIGYFAVITYKDGTCDFDTMTVAECLAIRDRSDGYKAFKEGKIKSNPWHTDEVEMCKKTLLRRLGKRQDQSPELRTAIQIEDEADFPHMIESEPSVAMVAPPPPEEPGAEAGPQTRDVRRAPAPPPENGATPKASRAERQKVPPARTFNTPKEMLAHIQSLFDAITPERLAAADADVDVLQNLWDDEVEPLLKDAFPPDVDEAQAIMRQAGKRLEP